MVFSCIAPSPDLRGFVRDYLIAHFRFDPEKPIPHKRYAPKPEQGITFFVRGRPTITNPLTGEIQVKDRDFKRYFGQPYPKVHPAVRRRLPCLSPLQP
ncbi:hypothetical protein BH23GEM9_BH23GEM9_26770 [soil metagenome]